MELIIGIMKKYSLLTVMIAVVVLLGIQSKGFGQLLMEENFSYPAGDLITAHGWTAHSGGGTQPITVSSSGLIFPGYVSSGIGNAALVDNTGEDDNRVFAVQSAGVVYTAFMVNVTTTAAGYFFHLGGDPVGSTFRGKVFMDATNHFGASMGSNTGTFAANAYTPGVTYLLVLKYEIVSGTSNDIVSLFIFDSAIPGSEPATPSVGPLTDAAMSDINPGAVALRQFVASQNLTVDGIRVGMSWADILPSAIVTPSIQAHDITFSSITGTGMTTGWTNGDGANRIAIINTSNTFTNPIDGADPVANPVYTGTGQQVIYNGNGNSVSVTGLTGNITYWFRVYEYNGSGSSTKFLTTTANLNPNSQQTPIIATAPVISAPASSSIGSNSAILGGNITSDGGSAITQRGTVWGVTPGVTIADNNLPEGATATGIFSHLRTTMPVKSKVYFKAYATNNVGTSLTSESSFFTLANEPTGHVAGFVAAAGGNTSINLTWGSAAPGADGYLILLKTGGVAPSGIPLDGTGYSEGNTLGDGFVAAIVSPSSTLNQTITGLSAGTQYSFTIFPFAWDGANNETFNYYIAPIVPSASATTTGSASTTYTWQGADNGSWTTPGNWTPTRSTPAPGDILQFNDGTTKTITGVPAQTITRFVMGNNTSINLQSGSPATLTITGAAGPDLYIPAGCSLNFNAINAITMTIATTGTAIINGNVKFSSTAATAHRLTGADPGSVTFGLGSIFTAGTSFSGSPFGTTSLNSVIFSDGSTYIQQAGSNPFGAGQPNSVVVFQTGSLFKVMANLTPSFSGRTYANFEMDAVGVTLSPSGTSPVSIDNLTITTGTFNFNVTGPTSGLHQIHGNLTVQSGAFLNFTPASAGTVSFSGGIDQFISVSGTLTQNTNSTFEIANGSNVILNSPITVNGHLELTNGFITLGNNNLTLSATTTITGTPSATAMIVPTGSGQLFKTMTPGFTGSVTFPVGDNTGTPEYSPVSLNFTGGTFATGSKIGVNLVNAKYPSDPNNVNYLSRYWSVSASGVTGFNCDAIFQYLPADVTGIEDQMFSMQVVPMPFTDFGLVNGGMHQVTPNGLTAFGTFTGSQPRPRVQTNPADLITATTATLHGEVIACYLPTAVSFEYGPTTSYGTVVTAFPATVNGGGTSTAIGLVSGLTQNTLYHFRIIGTNLQGTSYGNDLTFTTLCPAPSTGGTITGPSSVCPNGSGYIYTVPAIANATSYNWTLPSGATITSGTGTNTITVSYSASATSGNISVYGISVCGNGASSPAFAITMNTLPVPVIAGPATACINSPGNVYSTETGMSGYNWTISSGGTITAGLTTNTVLVTWNSAGAQSISVSYTNGIGCTAANPTSYPVNVTPMPTPTISGPNVVCANASGIVYTTEPGMTNYNWAVSIGGTIVGGAGTNAITVLWPYPGQRSVSVMYSTPIGCAAIIPTVYNVTINPAAVPTIGSTSDPCINSTNNQYITNSGMSNYLWEVSPGGTLVSGQFTSTINVTWNSIGAQWVKVSFTNTYGCAAVTPSVYTLFVNPVPNPAGPVTGTDEVCAGAAGIGFSCEAIMNATSYHWLLPTGAFISGGAGTNQILVDFPTGSASGTIAVAGQNECGLGDASPGFSMTINPIPAAPVVTASGAVLTSSAPTGNQWYFEGTAIPGATGKIHTATATGNYWCVVTLNGCSSAISNKVYVLITGLEDTENEQVRIFPVPNDGTFDIAISGNFMNKPVIRIFNPLGIKIFETQETLSQEAKTIRIDLRPVPVGVYTVVVEDQGHKIVSKVIVTK